MNGGITEIGATRQTSQNKGQGGNNITSHSQKPRLIRRLLHRALGIKARRQLFERYAENYHERFRAAIDYQFAEEPRQVFGLFILITGCIAFGMLCDHDIINNDYGTAARSGLSVVVFATVIYCYLQTRDGLLVRPHPGFWRFWHAIGLVHLLVFCTLTALPVNTGRKFIGLLLHGLTTLRDRTIMEGTEELDCELSLRTLKIQISKVWFIAHTVGWFAKMCIFRDWSFCLFFSAAFEIIELSFQWLIPEMKECWWDSILLDFGLSNMAGMLVGAASLRLINSVGYDWINKRPRSHSILKTVVMRFTPFTWSKYHWSFFRTPERLLQAAVLLSLALLSELNAFLMMHALEIPSSHRFHLFRLIYLCFLAVSGVAETYHYVNQGAHPHLKRRIGHNAWLFVSIILIELIVILRYGRSKWFSIVPSWSVIIPWIITICLILLWCLFHFVIVGPERLDVPVPLWTKAMSQLQQNGVYDDALIPSNSKFDKNNSVSPNHLELSKASSYKIIETTKNDDGNATLRRRDVQLNPQASEQQMSGENNGSSTPSSSNEKFKLDSMEFMSLAKYMSPLKSKNDDWPIEEISNEKIRSILETMKIRMQKWGSVFNLGIFIVALPPLLCVTPLLSLFQFYKFD